MQNALEILGSLDLTQKHIIVMRGAPASGKTTFAKRLVRESRNNHSFVRVGRDDLRSMLVTTYDEKNEWIVKIAMRSIVELLMQLGKNIVVDATHLGSTDMEYYETIVDGFNTHILHVIDLTDVELNVLLERDRARKESVGDSVIRYFWNRIHEEAKEQVTRTCIF